MSKYMVQNMSLAVVITLVFGCSPNLPKRERPSVSDGPGLQHDLPDARAPDASTADIKRHDKSEVGLAADLVLDADAAGNDAGVSGDGTGDGPTDSKLDVVPDANILDGSGKLKLVQGGFATVGPPKGTTKIFRLRESGFEPGDRICSALYCVTGGIMP